MNAPNGVRVMQEIWSRSEGAFVFLPHRSLNQWVEGGPSDPFSDGLHTAMAYRTEGDQYFSPLRYNGPQRRRGNVGRPGVIFADLDSKIELPLRPSILIASSRGRGHGYWFLEDLADMQLWEQHARGWTQELGADPGGWDLTQVLRRPETYNYKYNPPQYVRVAIYEPYREYKLEDFPVSDYQLHFQTELTPPQPHVGKHRTLLDRALRLKRLPLGSKYWLASTTEELTVLGKIDRSKIMWQVERQLLEAGFDTEEVFQLLWYAGINKYGKPGALWREILKAAGA